MEFSALEISQGKIVNQEYSSHADVKTLLCLLHDYYELSWPRIEQLPEINPPGAEIIPWPTLYKIARIGKVPKKWRARFGVGAIDNRPRTMIHLENPASAAQTLRDHMSPDNRMDLIQILAKQDDINALITVIILEQI